MPTLKSAFLSLLAERGLLHQCTHLDALDHALHTQTISAYIGFDCTAPSLHVGSLLQIMTLRWLQQCGHRPIVLMGGGTTKVGDPSGRDETRRLLTAEQIDENMCGIRTVFRQFLTFDDDGGNAIMVNNDDWLSELHYIDFLRDIGRHFSVNHMLSMDSVRLRLEREQHLSFIEFNYMVLQAYDFVELHRRHGCRLQIGGSDQWGNIVSGVELYRRIHSHDSVKQSTEEPQLFGLTTPLLTTSTGAKMGKTAQGAVWLDQGMLSPYDYWQFWRNTHDADVGKYLRIFTELPLQEIAKLEALQGAELNDAKKILATQATMLCHGKEAALLAEETARRTFEEGSISEHLNTVIIPSSLLAQGIPAYELFHTVGLKESKGEARKLIEGGGARLNDVKINDPRMRITLADVSAEGMLKLSAGKKQHLLVRPE